MQDVRNHADYSAEKIGKNLAGILYIRKDFGE